MGISGSALITALSNARGSYLQGKEQGQEKAQANALQQALLLKKQQDDEQKARLAEALNKAQIGHLGAQTESLKNPPKPRDYVAEHAANRDYDVKHPMPVTASTDPLVQVLSGGKRIYTPRSQAVGKEAPGPEGPQPDRVLVQISDPDNPEGPGKYVTREEALGQHAPAKPKAENAMNVAANARLQAAVSEMNNAHTNMADYERKLINKTANISGLSQFLGATANSFTHDDPASRAVQSAALAALNHTNPELARYIRRGLSFAEGESMVSQRPSDFRTKMAAFLSTAASGASPEMIADIEGRRSSILNPLNETVGSGKAKKASSVAPESEAEWAAKNPPHAGESFEAYHARYMQSKGGK